MEDLKRKLLLSYIQTKLNVKSTAQKELLKYTVEITRIQYGLKYQILESEGPAEAGRAWLSVNAMAHSYYFNEKTQSNVGTYIWKKNEPILFHGSLLHDMPRNQVVQLLETGTVLSIAYEDLLKLRQAFPAIAQHIEDLSNLREQSYQERIIHLNAPAQDRVVQFEADNPEFSIVANSTTKAMHVGLSRQTYNRILKKINDQGNDESDDPTHP